MKQKALLIGNDINNINANYSWSNLLQDLISHAKLTKAPAIEGKPFPLLYEEILLQSAKRLGTTESSIKAYIASNTKLLKPNSIHSEIVNLGIDTILTTNYDLTLEKTLTKNLDDLKNLGPVKESRYNLFRKHTAGNINVWHIHGHEKAPASITLGYEHYSGYLQQMRNYVTVGIKGGYSHKDFNPLSKRIKDNSIQHESWLDYFFTHNIHILGLNLDFVEIHLWWLLTYRARMIVIQKVKLPNTIYYYYPKKFEQLSKHKLDLLKVNEVKTIPLSLKNNNRTAYYRSVISKIKNT